MTYQEKLKLIKKRFRKATILLDVEMINYDGCNIYIRLDYFKKQKVHKISWVDLNITQDKDILAHINSEIVPTIYLENIASIINGSEIDKISYFDKNVLDGLVKFNLYFNNNKKTEKIGIIFHRYVPKQIAFIYNIILNLFDNLPKRLDFLLDELRASIDNKDYLYDYGRPFVFDLFNQDYNLILKKQVINASIKNNLESKIKFLEKIHDKYFIYMEDNRDYLVIINYNNKTNETALSCSCGNKHYCKHIHAAISAIRNHNKRKFYKVTTINKDDNYMEKIAKFNYFLCAGVKDDKLIIIGNYGMIEYVPIVDNNKNITWKIIEDDKNKSLEKSLEKYI